MITAESILKPRVTLAVLEQRAGRSLPVACKGTLAERVQRVVKAFEFIAPDGKKTFYTPADATLKAKVVPTPLATRISNLLRAAEATPAATVPHGTMPTALATARQRAQHIYEAAALAAIAAVEAKKKSTKEQKRKDEAAILLLLLMAGEDAYRETHQALQPAGTPKTQPAGTEPTPAELDTQTEAFAEQRQTVLHDFSGRLADTIRQTRDEAADAGKSPVEVARELRRKVAKESEVMADTEAQVTLGSVQLDRLKRAGFTSAVWMTQEDERVRPTHVKCGEQGAVELGKPFSNGLLYPGDPNGPASEVISCRCWLVGASRKPTP